MLRGADRHDIREFSARVLATVPPKNFIQEVRRDVNERGPRVRRRNRVRQPVAWSVETRFPYVDAKQQRQRKR